MSSENIWKQTRPLKKSINEEADNSDASLGFFEDGQDLAVGKSGLLHVGSPCPSKLENPTFESNYYQVGIVKSALREPMRNE